MWLSLWDEQAEPVELGTGSPAFWTVISQHSRRCSDRLRQIARHVLQGEPIVTDLDRFGGVAVIGVPVSYRGRVVASMLACGLSPEMLTDGEILARFCSHHELDCQVIAQLAREVQPQSKTTLYSYAEIFQQCVESFCDGVLAHRDIMALSANLAEAYEELNLIYRASTSMMVSSSPAEPFEKLGEELLEATVVESFASVIEMPTADTPEPIVVTAGPLRASRDDVLRLYRQLQSSERNAGGSLVVNNAAADPAFAWAGEWLEQVVFVELSTKNRVFGAIMAINHRDHDDFGSQEIQLINTVAERCSVFLENMRLYEDLEQLFMGMLHSLVSSIDAKDPYTRGHSQRVAWLSRHIARIAGKSPRECERVYLSGLLHDIGKIGISESVLRKTGKLTDEEFAEMKRHPEIGAHILEGVRQVADLIPGVLYHHERLDGRGYPHRLRGNEIPFLGRVLCLADSFDAMTTDRTYRSARPLSIAISEVRRCAGTQFDPQLAELFLREDIAALKRSMFEAGSSLATTGLIGNASPEKEGAHET